MKKSGEHANLSKVKLTTTKDGNIDELFKIGRNSTIFSDKSPPNS